MYASDFDRALMREAVEALDLEWQASPQIAAKLGWSVARTNRALGLAIQQGRVRAELERQGPGRGHEANDRSSVGGRRWLYARKMI